MSAGCMLQALQRQSYILDQNRRMQSTCWITWITIPAVRLKHLLKAIKNPMLRSFRKLSISSRLPAWTLPMIIKSSKTTLSFQEKPLQKKQFITSRTKLQSSRKRQKTASSHSKISSTSMTELFRRSYETPTYRNWQKP